MKKNKHRGSYPSVFQEGIFTWPLLLKPWSQQQTESLHNIKYCKYYWSCSFVKQDMTSLGTEIPIQENTVDRI